MFIFMQMSRLLQSSILHARAYYQHQIESSGEIFNWLTILWERGFHHDNPQGSIWLCSYFQLSVMAKFCLKFFILLQNMIQFFSWTYTLDVIIFCFFSFSLLSCKCS